MLGKAPRLFAGGRTQGCPTIARFELVYAIAGVPIRAGCEPSDAAEGVSTDVVEAIGGTLDIGQF
jgi:hypothetical protein